MTGLNDDENKEYAHNWNTREEKLPIGRYILIGLLCLVLGWLLGSAAGQS
jgi:hypothetical protein